MLTKTNMLTAAYENMNVSTNFADGSVAAYLAAVDAIQYASMALGAAQEPRFDAKLAQESAALLRLAKERLQACVEAQIGAAAQDEFDEAQMDAWRQEREEDAQHPDW